MSTPKNIHLRLPNWVGDLVMCTPALRALRHGFPDAKITVEGRSYMRGLMEPLETVDDFLDTPSPERGVRPMFKRVRSLRSVDFDLSLVLPDSHSSALGPFLARIPRRVGYSFDPGRRLLLTERLAPHQEDGQRVPISMIERYLQLTRHLGCQDQGDEMTLVVTDESRGAVATRLAEHGIDENQPILLCITGASYGSSKMWPAEYFAEAADALGRRHGLRTVLAPGPGEESTGGQVGEHMSEPCTVLMDPVLTLAEMAALVERARVVISNDTGPRSMAVALGIPCVVPFGPTDQRYTNHHLENQTLLSEDVDCAPCGLKACPTDHRCMRDLLPERIIEATSAYFTVEKVTP
ncbi:MAG: lipopolysaccharide heptosyltransferase II [Planctomycetota bacterium]|nr:lipopolysaccharide heptosyltransferase II [Planctomycetota bacterium]